MSKGNMVKVRSLAGTRATVGICAMFLCGVMSLSACSKKDTAGKTKPVAV